MSRDDPRFDDALRNPIFARRSKAACKTKIDDRFSAALTDERFRLPDAPVDKYGRKGGGGAAKAGKGKARAKAELAAFYTVDDGEEDALAAAAAAKRFDRLTRMARGDASASESSGSASDSDGTDGSDSSDSDSDSSDDGENLMVEDSREAARVEHDILPEGAETSRLAVCSLNWDRMSAVDVLAVLQSFCPSKGLVRTVAVYESDYGAQKLAEEVRVLRRRRRRDGGDGGGDGLAAAAAPRPDQPPST